MIIAINYSKFQRHTEQNFMESYDHINKQKREKKLFVLVRKLSSHCVSQIMISRHRLSIKHLVATEGTEGSWIFFRRALRAVFSHCFLSIRQLQKLFGDFFFFFVMVSFLYLSKRISGSLQDVLINVVQFKCCLESEK